MPAETISANDRAEGSRARQSKKKGRLNTGLIVILWICLFPIMFTIWAVKTPRFKKKSGLVAIAAVWIFSFIVAGCASTTNAQLAEDRTLDFNAIEILDDKAVVKATATNNTSSNWSSTAYLVINYSDGGNEKLPMTISCEEGSSVELVSTSFSTDGISGFETDYADAQITYSAGDLMSLLSTEQERVAVEEEIAAQKKAEEEAAAAEAEAQQKAMEEAAAAEAQARAEAEAAAEAQAQAEAEAAARAQEQENARNNQTVYVTATGSKFHSRQGCTGLNNANSISETTREQAEAMGLEPCKKCY